MADYIALATSIKRSTRERQALELAEAVLTGKLVERGLTTSNKPLSNAKSNAMLDTPSNGGPFDKRAYQREYMKRWRAKKKPSV